MIRTIIAGIVLILNMGVSYGHTSKGSDHPVNSWAGFGQPSIPLSTVKATPTKRNTRHHVVHQGRRVHHGHTTVPVLPKESGDLVTVPTAAGISITVAKKLVPQFQGFVADLVKLGYTPKHIGCWAPVGTHVANSNHYHGGACDFDQTGWNRTAYPMYHISAIASKWNLRDGCSFHASDCGHIDDGTNIAWRHPNNLIARYIDHQMAPAVQDRPLDNFEGGM